MTDVIDQRSSKLNFNGHAGASKHIHTTQAITRMFLLCFWQELIKHSGVTRFSDKKTFAFVYSLEGVDSNLALHIDIHISRYTCDDDGDDDSRERNIGRNF